MIPTLAQRGFRRRRAAAAPGGGGGTVTFGSISYDEVSSTSDTVLNPAKPTSLSAGELMLAIACCTTRSISAPGSWSSLAAVTSDPRLYLFYKVADSSDAMATNFGFSISGTFSEAGVALLRLLGATTTGLASQNTLTASSQTQACPNIASTAGGLIVWGVGYDGGAMGACSSTRGTERREDGHVAVYTEEMASAGTQTGPTITTASFGAKRTFSIFIPPA